MEVIFKLGVLLFLISTLLVFGSDRLFKKGKIKTLKDLLIFKALGLGITVIAVIMMIYGK